MSNESGSPAPNFYDLTGAEPEPEPAPEPEPELEPAPDPDVQTHPYPLVGEKHEKETKRYQEHNKKTVYPGPVEEWTERLTKEGKDCSKCHKWKLIMNYEFNCSGNCHFNKEGLRHTRPECKDCGKKEGKTCALAKAKSKKAGEPTKAPEGMSCEICKKKCKLVYDHDHETCEFRGWLCDPCNRGLGQCGDDIDGLVKRMNYLISKSSVKPAFIQNEDGSLSVS